MSNPPVDVVELTTDEQRIGAWPVLRELRDRLDLQAFRRLLADMVPGGYRMFAAQRDGTTLGIAGIAIRTNLYYGRYLYVYDLVTTAASRSTGVGAALLSHLEGVARDEGCDVIALSSGVQRADAHRFYEAKMAYRRTSYEFVKSL